MKKPAHDLQTIDTIARRVDGENAEYVETQTAPRDLRGPIRFGIGLLIFGLGGFFLWAATAPLDEGVPVPGTLVVESKRKTVQNLSAGSISEILVKEGQTVKQGDVVMRLDPLPIRAQREAADVAYITARANESRLIAEQSGATSIGFHPDLLLRAREPSVASLMATQKQFFDARRGVLQAEMSAIQENISGLEAQVRGLELVQRERDEQARSLDQEINSLAPMVAEGLFARNRHQEMQRQLGSLRSAVADGLTSAARLRSQIAEMKLRMAQRQQEYRKEVEGQLTQVAQEARAQSERLAAAQQELSRTEIRSPVTGKVFGMFTSTPGAVVGSGTKLMEIVPQGDRLLVEAEIPLQHVQNVRVGLTADVRFTAVSRKGSPVVEGKVISLSADQVESTNPLMRGMKVFSSRIEISAEEARKLAEYELLPGMQVDTIIKTGERTYLTYLYKPMQDRLARGLKEK
ncbi:MAG: HlyD family type I secretion periplasmic adaptor subunit [Betaproteobacteria bacterium]|nr:HlyD family type I secretion periplasmic adaptor subunit [Betaproteobacteria bacterium]NBT05428.1 HlyD family type I secretion periplasmic adaptor subunit [Betaproteobacteria bacterium]NDE53464.1 HlyD family type I secretion periplasmic adaptor subunit [Actinomycetota bacterium]